MIPDVPEQVLQATERQHLIENVLVLGAHFNKDDDEPPANEEVDFIFNPSLKWFPVSHWEKIPQTDLSKAQFVPNT